MEGVPSGIVPPPALRRTPSQGMRDELGRRRSLPLDERELHVPGVHVPSPGLGPPSGMYRISDENEEQSR